MMRIGVFSDSHGDSEALDGLLARMGKLDAACFLGDIYRDAVYLRERLAKTPGQPVLYGVRGNCDGYDCPFSAEVCVKLGGKRIYMTHGHLYPSILSLSLHAKENGADICLYGHTHTPHCEQAMGLLILNPGSAGNKCRGGRARASVIEIVGEKITVSHYQL